MLENKRCPKCLSTNFCCVAAKQYPDQSYFFCGSCFHIDKIEFLVENNFLVIGIKILLKLVKNMLHISKS